MLDSHQHFVFVFHDDFVEALAAGIWLDVPEDDPLQMGGEHPLAGLPASTAPAKGSTAGLSWELVRSQRAEADLLNDARLCSQPLFAFNLILDGGRSGDATAWLRVRDGVATSRFARSWVGEVASARGVAKPKDFLADWEFYCDEVADRRRAMGNSRH